MFNRMRLNAQIFLLLTITIAILMLFFLGWDSYIEHQHALEHLRMSTVLLANELSATCRFITQNQDSSNNLNPSSAMRGISDIFNGMMGYTFKQTSLHVRNPQNAPDEFETKMLNRLSSDKTLTETWELDTVNGNKVFRYLRPLYYENDCLRCHGEVKGEFDSTGYPKEGAKAGDFAGALSIIEPTDRMDEHLHNMLSSRFISLCILWLTLTFLIYLIIHKCFVQPLAYLTSLTKKIGRGDLTVHNATAMSNRELQALYDSFHTMAENLKEVHDSLESKVNERTYELAIANETLQMHQQSLQKINEKLVTASKVKSEFIATMSHELQTPLTAIIAFAEVILEYGTEKDEVAEYTYDIYESAHHLLDLITDILDLSKIEEGKLQLHPSVFDIVELTAVLERIFYPLLKRNEVTLQIEVPDDLPAIQADKNKLKQILMNLLSNAIKFTPAGGQVFVNIEYLAEEHKLLIAIKDTGKGMSHEDISLIFDKFFQLDSGTTKEYGGIGLGLSITKQLTELHNGIIWVESAVGHGSIFYVKLPLYQIPHKH